MSNLMTASNQWAMRPDDERFSSLQELFEATNGWHKAAKEYTRPTSELRLGIYKDEPVIVGSKGGGATFTHFGFGQLCRKLSAPADFARSLKPETVCTVLNERITQLSDDDTSVFLMHENGGRAVRAITSEKYSRIWNDEIVQWLGNNLPQGWTVPPARPARAGQKGTRTATPGDVLQGKSFSLSINVGDEIAPAGLYASDHDMFVFMVDQTRPITVGHEVLYRGFFIDNNEVGSGSLRITRFLYDTVCGNHIVWGAKQVEEVRIRHIGKQAYGEFNEARGKFISASSSSQTEDTYRIRTAMGFSLGGTKKEIVDLVYSKGIFSRKDAQDSYDIAEQYSDIHGDPQTAWGLMSGATRLSQMQPHQDKRDELDRAGRKVLELAF